MCTKSGDGSGRESGHGLCVSDTKLVAIGAPLISMTLSMFMMRNFSFLKKFERHQFFILLS